MRQPCKAGVPDQVWGVQVHLAGIGGEALLVGVQPGGGCGWIQAHILEAHSLG